MAEHRCLRVSALVFLLHDRPPLFVLKHCASAQRHRRQQLCHISIFTRRSLQLKSFSHARGVYVAFVPAFLRSLATLRMERESAEARVRDMEDQLAEFQDELRRETGNKTVLREQSHQHLTARFICFCCKDAEK